MAAIVFTTIFFVFFSRSFFAFGFIGVDNRRFAMN